MAGLVAGGAKYADMKLDEKQKAEQAERDKKLMELQQKVMEANARFKASLEAPKYQTIKDTGPDGQMRERTIRSSYDPETQGFVETEVGSAILPQKDGRTAFEVEAAYAEANPEKYAAMKAAGRAPRGGGAGSGGGTEALGFEDYETMDPERRALYDRWKGRATSKDQEAADRKWLATEVQKAISDFDSTASDRTARKNLLAGFGIDPESPDARKQYAKAYRADLESRFNPGEKSEPTPLMENAGGRGEAYPAFGDEFAPKTDILSSSKAASKAPPGSSRDNPAPAEAFKSKPPSGTWVKLPTGQVIQIP